MDPHAPEAIAHLPHPKLQQRIEHALSMWAAREMGDAEWESELKETDDARTTKTRFRIVKDNPAQLAVVVMLSSRSEYPQAWTNGVKAVLAIWPQARQILPDLIRLETTPGGDYEWRPPAPQG